MASELKNPFDDLGRYGIESNRLAKNRVSAPKTRPGSGPRMTPKTENKPLLQPENPAAPKERPAGESGLPEQIELEPVGPENAPYQPYGDIGPFGPRWEGSNPLFRNPFSDGTPRKPKTQAPTTQKILSPFVVKKESARDAVAIIVTAVVAVLWFLVKLPPLTLRLPPLYGAVVFICLIYFIVSFIIHGFDFKFSYKQDYWKFLFRHCKVMLVVVIIALAALVIALFSSWPLLRHAALAELMPLTVAEEPAAPAVPAVDEAAALGAGGALLAAEPDLTGLKIGGGDLCRTADGPAWVLYLEPAAGQKRDVDACITVDAVTGQAAVQPLPAPLTFVKPGYQMDRPLWFRHPAWVLGDPVFELDDSGRAFWVMPRLRNGVGLLSGAEVTGVLVLDAVTGEETLYAPDQVPGWVDHVYPADLLEKEYNFYGLYARGYRPPENKDEAVTRLRDPQPAILDDGLCLRAEIWDNGEEPAQVGVLTADLRTGAGLVSPVT